MRQCWSGKEPGLTKLVGPNRLRQRQEVQSTSRIRNRPPLGPYNRALPRALCWSQGGVLILMSEVTLYLAHQKPPPP